MFTIKKNLELRKIDEIIFTIVLLLFCFVSVDAHEFLFTVSCAFMVSYIFSRFKLHLYYNTQENILLSSLGMSRKKIIDDRYSAYLSYAIFITFTAFLGNLFFSKVSNYSFVFSLFNYSFVFFVSSTMFAINLVLEMFDQKCSSYISLAIYLAIFTAPAILNKLNIGRYVIDFIRFLSKNAGAGLTLLALSLIIYFISYMTSRTIFERKDF